MKLFLRFQNLSMTKALQMNFRRVKKIEEKFFRQILNFSKALFYNKINVKFWIIKLKNLTQFLSDIFRGLCNSRPITTIKFKLKYNFENKNYINLKKFLIYLRNQINYLKQNWLKTII
jgi:hypothetical protein